MPSLVLLLTVSSTLHFLGYYRNALTEGSALSPVQHAFQMAWRPVVYCAITTAIGLFSLTLSDTCPVRQFGKFGGISVLASAAVVLLCFPSWLSLFSYKAENF